MVSTLRAFGDCRRFICTLEHDECGLLVGTAPSYLVT
jgi:hypothetical protein